MNKLSVQNEILSKSRLGELTTSGDKILEVYPFNNIEHLLEESIHTFSRSQVWNWTETVTDLEYFSAFTSYYLSDFGIDYNRVKEVFFFDGAEKIKANRISYKKFRRLYAGLLDTGKPQVYSINNDVIRFYPKLNKDYGLKIRHYKQIPVLLSQSDEIEMIPERYQHPIPEYVNAVMTAILDKENAEGQHEQSKRSLSKVKKINQQYFNKKNIAPSRIRFY